MKPIHLNLAAKPYRDYRPVYAVVVVMSILVAFLMLNNIETYVRYVRDTRTTRDEVALIEAQIRQERARTEVVTKETSTIDLVTLSKESRFVNAQLAQRAFSWSELLDRLEVVVPGNVRITAVSPQFSDTGLVHLNIKFEGKSADSMLNTLARFQRDVNFASPFPTTQDISGAGYRFVIGVDYKPAVPRVVFK